MQLNPFMRCIACKKLHVRTFITRTTVCSCGVSLWAMSWDRIMKDK